jgi:hypothetical protein
MIVVLVVFWGGMRQKGVAGYECSGREEVQKELNMSAVSLGFFGDG